MKYALDTLGPDEFYDEVKVAMRQLGELAVALRLPLPAGLCEALSLTPQETIDLWVVSRASRLRIDEEWQRQADRLIGQALVTDAVEPGSSDPSS